eukprot:979527-Rhodomonas_salina.1
MDIAVPGVPGYPGTIVGGCTLLPGAWVPPGTRSHCLPEFGIPTSTSSTISGLITRVPGYPGS